MTEPEPKPKKPRKPRSTPPPNVKGMRKLPNHDNTRIGKLTAAQEAYCRARAMGMNQIEAVAAIGGAVTVHAGRKWEKSNQDVRDRIQELCAIATENAIIKTGLNREWVISRLMTVVDRCMQAEPVLVKGEPTGEYRFDSTGANTALKMLGDTMGLFKPAEKKPEDEYANLSDEDLHRIALELASQVGLVIEHEPAKPPTGDVVTDS